MIALIADGGATKTSWCLVNQDNKLYFETEGYHPFYVDELYIETSLKENAPSFVIEQADTIEQIYLYSAGGNYSDESDAILINGIGSIFTNTTISLETDILAAARALLQREKGLAAILGTGSNTCLYDGENIVHNIESLGFLIGDEGSGAYMGKLLLADYIRELMPIEIKNDLTKAYNITPEKVLNELYSVQHPNRYCAQFAKFIKENINNEYFYKLAYSNFDAFFKNIVSHYPNYDRYAFNAIGSIAYHFREIIEKVAKNYNIQVSNIAVSAIEGLVKYHMNNVL